MEGSRLKILLFEDNPLDARLIQRMLKDKGAFGFELEHAYRLDAGLARLAEAKFDLLILDLELPDSSGLETLRKVKACNLTTPPIVVLTGLDDDEAGAQAVQEGAQDYLIKGEVTSNLLVRSIRYAIERGHAEELLRKSEEKLRSSEAKYRTIVETANEGILAMDSQSRITFANQNIAVMLGRLPEEMLGHRVTDFMFKDTRDNGARKSPLYMAPGRYERRFWHKDGSSRCMIVSATAFEDCDGRFAGSFAMFTDITERKQIEQALKESEHRYRSLFESMDEGFSLCEMIFDEAGRPSDFRYLAVNPAFARLTGLPVERVVGRTVSELIPGIEPFWIEAYGRVVESGCSERIDNPVSVLGKHYEVYAWRSSIGRFAVVFSDMTERKRMEVELKKSHDELEQRVLDRTAELAVSNKLLLAEIAERERAEEMITASLKEKEFLLREIHHRVKNNLQVISSLLYLQSKRTSDNQIKEILQDSQNRVKSMALIHEKLYMSQKLARINLAEYTKSLVDYLYHCYGIHLDRIALRLDAEKIMVGADTAIPCGLIINELVSNSLKHAFPDGRKGEIYIEICSEGEQHFKMVIGDDGIGFEADPEKANTLGLLLVSTLVKQIDGSIRLDSSQGTRFEIAFKELKYKERC